MTLVLPTGGENPHLSPSAPDGGDPTSPYRPVDAALTLATALAFVGAGVSNALNIGDAGASFRRWGFPNDFRFLVAALEVGGGLASLSLSTRAAALALLGAVITTAIATLVGHRSGWGHLAPALGFATLLVLDGFLS